MAPTFSIGCRVIIINQSSFNLTEKCEHIGLHGVIVDTCMFYTLELYLVHIDGYEKPWIESDDDSSPHVDDFFYDANSLIFESHDTHHEIELFYVN